MINRCLYPYLQIGYEQCSQEGDKTLEEVAKEGDADGERTEAFIEKQDPDFDPENPDDAAAEGLPEDDAAEIDDGTCLCRLLRTDNPCV